MNVLFIPENFVLCTYRRHSSMDAGIQSQGCVLMYAILGFWISAIPAGMTYFISANFFKALSTVKI